MAFTGNAFCTSAKVGFLTGTYVPLTDTMKIALYTNDAALTAATTAYTASVDPAAAPTSTGEVSTTGTNYTAGGNTLITPVISSGGTTAWLTFSDSSWTTATFTARGALIYDSSASNAAIAVLDFGADKTSTAGTFTVQMPLAGASTALIRIA
jgi:hypothetical protein